MLLLVLACADPDPSPKTESTPTTGGELECSAAVDDTISLVIGVEWEAPEGTSYVMFGETEEQTQRTPVVTGSGPLHLDLIGLPANTPVYWTGVTETADGTWTCSGTTTTGPNPEIFPEITVSINETAGQADAPYVLGSFFGLGLGQVTLAAYRRDGTLVWYYLGDTSRIGLDIHYAQDGDGLLFNQFAIGFSEDAGEIHRISFGGDVLAVYDTPLGHHMFTELPDGTLAYQQLDIRSYTDPDSGETDDWVGDAVVEIAPDGTMKTVFSVWDYLTPAENDFTSAPTFYPGVDWTHGNAIAFNANTDTYLLSLGHPGDLLTIDRSSGALTQIIGANGQPTSPSFAYQHDAHWLDNGNLLMFMTDDSGSGAVEYAPGDGELVEVWRHGFVAPSPYLGQARRLENGNTFVNYGGGSTMQEVTPDGEVVWQMGTEMATSFGQFQLVSDLYTGAP